LEQIKRAGGASAGAINALLFGLGYSPSETKDLLMDLDFTNFLDDSWGVMRDSKRLLEKFGWYKGDFFRKWIGQRIEEKTGNPEATFKEMYDLRDKKGFRDLYMVGVNLSTHFGEVFSNEHTPRMPLADAVRISMSIPLFFAAKRSLRGDIYVDGGLLNNYPIKLFDREKYLTPKTLSSHGRVPDYYKKHNASLKRRRITVSPYLYNLETLGFRLDSAREIAVFRDQAEPPREEIDDFFSYLWALVETIFEGQANEHLHSDDWQRTIYIDTLGVKTTDFKLSRQKKEALIQSGRDHTRSYFDDWYDREDLEEPPVNRPVS
jgi:NTE family protein